MKENIRNFLDREGGKINTQSQMQEFWSFRKLITPFLVQVLFWVAALFVLVAGFLTLTESIYRKEGLETLVGISLILFGPFVIRMQSEMIIVLFRISESLDEIKKKTNFS